MDIGFEVSIVHFHLSSLHSSLVTEDLLHFNQDQRTVLRDRPFSFRMYLYQLLVLQAGTAGLSVYQVVAPISGTDTVSGSMR